VPLYTKCPKCGGWKQAAEYPTTERTYPTAPMMNAPQAPGKQCTCDGEAPPRSA